MSNLIEQLRRYMGIGATLLKEAADEIEKLQSKLAIERERFIKIVADQTDAEGLCSADDILRALGDEK